MRGIRTQPKRLLGARDGWRTRQILSTPLGWRMALRVLCPLVFALGIIDARQAAADDGTRTLSFFHTHTRETATVTFRRNGQYDDKALEQLNWFLRDWRVEQPTKMDPRLFDILWEVYRESGSSQPIQIVSAYRSPETNGALRNRSKAVSEHSQHMLGKAMDVRIPDVSTDRLREIAMKMQYGGVGYYGKDAFVHVDTGSVRAWPRMTEQQLAQLFPDGKTLHLPSNGKPLAGYEEAKAEIPVRNAALATQASAGGGSLGGLLATLFKREASAPTQAQPASEARTVLAYASPEGLDLETPVVAAPPAPLPPKRPQIQLLRIENPPAVPQSQAPTVSASPVIPAAHKSPPTIGLDERAAIRALFDPRAAFLDVGFSAYKDDLSTTHFSGPAIKPLPLLRNAQAASKL